MAWCIQCGSAGTPELAIGVDEEGEAACAMHRIKPSRFEVATAAFSPQPAIQKREEAVMDPAMLKKCPGYKKDCPEMIGPRAELCSKCYGNRAYHSKQDGKAPKKSFVLKAPKGVKLPNPEPQQPATPLSALKARLLRELAAVEAVEKLLGFQLATDTASGD